MPEPIVSLNEESMKADPRKLVRRTVEEMPDGLIGAGHYERRLATTSGEVTIHMPKPKGTRFTAAIIEWSLPPHTHEAATESAAVADSSLPRRPIRQQIAAPAIETAAVARRFLPRRRYR